MQCVRNKAKKEKENSLQRIAKHKKCRKPVPALEKQVTSDQNYSCRLKDNIADTKENTNICIITMLTLVKNKEK